MPGSLGIWRSVGARGLFFLGLIGAAPAAAIDLSGVYVSQIAALSMPCTLTFAQSGTALTVTGPCTLGSTTYTYDLSGTVDPVSGAFSVSGELIGLCETPDSVSVTGNGDGEVFSALSSCGSLSSGLSGTKCGNGSVDAAEDCEDGNTAAGDCCSPTCQFEAAGSACAADTNSCTDDVCDGAGQCQHQPLMVGAPCATDFNDCTDDRCDAAGSCTHAPLSATACDDTNACTTADTCDAGTCVGGPIAPECVGSLDLTGDWDIMVSTGGLFESTNVHHFVQNGAVLESTIGQGVGIGSVNPATRSFESHTPYVVLVTQCLELIGATATPDGQSFSGNVVVNCGLDGIFGPYAVTGQRCAPGTACACATTATCTAPDMSRIAMRVRIGGTPTRWQWLHAPLPGGLGDPLANDDYQLCVETTGGGYTQLVGHGEGWRAMRSGFRYRGTSGIVRTLVFKVAPKTTLVSATLSANTPPALPTASAVRVRLVRTGEMPICIEAVFTQPSVNISTRYIATE